MAMQEEDQRRSAADALGQLPSRSDAVGSEAAVKQAYNDWQATKPSWFSQQTPTGRMREQQAEAAYTKALQDSYGQVKFGGNPGATALSTPAPSTPQYATLASVEGTKKPSAADALMGTTQPSVNQVMPGVYNHGRGQYSDSPDGMNFKPGFTGQPSAQNMNAADALAGRSQNESIARVAASQPPQQGAAQAMMAAPATASSGSYDWMADLRDPRNLALRNASVGSTIFRNRAEAMMASRDRQARIAGVQAAIGGQMHDAQQADTARYQADNNLAGNLGAEQMRQQGANARAVLSSGIDAKRVAIEQERANNESRAARQLETQRSIAIDPRSTPEQRSAAERALMTLGGRQTADPYLVVPGGQHIDPQSGKAYNTPASVFNRQSGQFVQQPGAQGATTVSSPEQLAALPSGSIYTGPDGKQYRKN